MNVTYSCPHCQRAVRADCDESVLGPTGLACPACSGRVDVPEDAFAPGPPRRCLVCPSTDLFVRKDFPQRLGVAIVVLGFVASSIAWYHYSINTTFAILFATALADLALYLFVGNALVCYRCGASYRHADGLETHAPFNLETHERYRQQAARLAERSTSPPQGVLPR